MKCSSAPESSLLLPLPARHPLCPPAKPVAGTAGSSLEQTNTSLVLSSNSKSTGEPRKAAKARSSGKKARQIADDDAERPVPGAPVVRIIFRADRDLSSTAAAKAGEALREARRSRRAELL